MSSLDDNFSFGEPPKHLGRARLPRKEYVALITSLAVLVGALLIWRVAAGSEVTPPGAPAPGGAGAAGAGPGNSNGSTDVTDAGELPRSLAKLLEMGLPVYCGAGTKPMVALTFDDGPGAYTSYTIDTLRNYNAKATFFLVGKLLGNNTSDKIAREEARFGDVGNHAWSHFGLAGEPRSVLDREVKRTKKAMEEATGEPVIYFRPPWGSRDKALDDYVKDLGMIEMMWTFDTYDSQGANSDKIVKTVLGHAHPGSIILMHENRGTTKNALDGILSGLAEKGLQPVTLTTMLTLDPPDRNQLKQGLQGC